MQFDTDLWTADRLHECRQTSNDLWCNLLQEVGCWDLFIHSYRYHYHTTPNATPNEVPNTSSYASPYIITNASPYTASNNDNDNDNND
jgi:hypothetical protein